MILAYPSDFGHDILRLQPEKVSNKLQGCLTKINAEDRLNWGCLVKIGLFRYCLDVQHIDGLDE